MNREIKFRAWDKNRNAWYWSYAFIREDGELFSDDVLVFDTPNKEITSLKDNLIIEQYTGLKDKNGKEIYEGDVIEAHSGEYYMGVWEYKSTHTIEDIRSLPDVFIFCDEIEIIGNIHENKELLEEHND